MEALLREVMGNHIIRFYVVSLQLCVDAAPGTAAAPLSVSPYWSEPPIWINGRKEGRRTLVLAGTKSTALIKLPSLLYEVFGLSRGLSETSVLILVPVWSNNYCSSA